MADDNQLVQEFFEERRRLILQKQESKGLKASGLSARLLTINEQGNVFQLVDESGYFEFQEFGRRGGKAPQFQKIWEWVGLKKYGINFENELQRRRIAWAILINIKKNGTYTFRRRTQTGVLTEAINDQLLDELSENLSSNHATEILTDITRILNRAA